MKFTFLTFVIISLIIFESPAQNRFRRGGGDPQKKIDQLEKVKLLEVLEVDDETAVRFFNLKDRHQKDMKELRDKSDQLIDQIEETLSSSDSKKLEALLAEFRNNEQEMHKMRMNFLKEAENLLPPEKFARFVVFERNFRAEIRQLLMGDRMKNRMRDND